MRLLYPWLWSATLYPLVFVSGCSDEAPPATQRQGSVLDSAPVAVFGAEEDDPLFGVAGGVILDDGVAIADEGSGTIRYYDLNGQLRHVAGGKGHGPGEFQRPLWLQEAGGTLFAYDLDLRRISEFSTDGAFLGSTPFANIQPYTFLFPVGMFADRSVLVRASAREPTERAVGVVRPEVALLRFRWGATNADSLGWYHSPESYAEPWGRGGVMYLPLAFGRESAVVVNGSRYFVVQNDNKGIEVFDTAGVRLRNLGVEHAVEQPVITADHIAAARRRLVSQETPQLQRSAAFDRMPKPEKLPAYGWAGRYGVAMLRVSREGDVWVLNYGGLFDQSPRWTVIRSDGSLRGYVTNDEEVSLLDVKGEHALVLRWNENDVETVALTRIIW